MSNHNLSFDEEENMSMFRPVMDEEYVRAVNEYWRQVEVSDYFDIEGIRPVGGMMDALVHYKGGFGFLVDLYARVGLQRYNMKEGTNFEFQRVIKYNMEMHFVSPYYITLAACDTVSRGGSMKIFQVQVNENCLGRLDLTCSVARLKGDTTSKHFPPQGDYVVPLALPGWPTDEEFNIMQVNGSELLDSIRVYAELAVRKHDMSILDDLSKLEIVRVAMETSNGDVELPNERLNAKNATFYITFTVVAFGGIVEDVEYERKLIVRRVVNESTGDLSLRGRLF